jgi:hypothetical protein
MLAVAVVAAAQLGLILAAMVVLEEVVMEAHQIQHRD